MEHQGWPSYEKLVLDKLSGLEHRVNEIDEKLVLLRIDVAQLKVKAGVWGATAGLLPALAVLLLSVVGGH